MSVSPAMQSTSVPVTPLPYNGSASAVASSPVEPRPVRWTREQYHKMGELGWFENKRVELIEGDFVEMSPMARPHALSLWKTTKMLEAAFGEGFFVQSQIPLPIPPFSEPEPDVAVFPGAAGDYRDENPSNAALAVEISDSTLRFDRTTKASLYARAAIPEYWIVDLIHNQLIVHRRPQEMDDQPFGFGYALIEVLSTDAQVAPLAAAENSIAVADLLP
jgi:Uma2 family endonuclease